MKRKYLRKHQLKVDRRVVLLPERIYSGPVSKLEEGCLFVVFQGKGKRLFLSKELMDFAGIDREVVVIDYGNYYEIWDPDKLERHEKRIEERYEEIAENLEMELY